EKTVADPNRIKPKLLDDLGQRQQRLQVVIRRDQWLAVVEVDSELNRLGLSHRLRTPRLVVVWPGPCLGCSVPRRLRAGDWTRSLAGPAEELRCAPRAGARRARDLRRRPRR